MCDSEYARVSMCECACVCARVCVCVRVFMYCVHYCMMLNCQCLLENVYSFFVH